MSGGTKIKSKKMMRPRIKVTHPFLLLILALFLGCNQEKARYKASVKSIAEAVYASGNIVPANQYTLMAKVEGYLAAQHVQEGDVVKANQELFVIESMQQEAQNNQALNAYLDAKANLNEDSPVLGELALLQENARKQMEQDSVVWMRYKNLLKENATSLINFENAQLKYKTAIADWKRAQEKYRQTKNQLALALKNAAANLQITEDQQQSFKLSSHIDGMVFKVYPELGGLITRNQPLAIIGDNKEKYLELLVDELDIALVKVGQRVLVKVDIFPGEIWEAEVSKINKLMEQKDQSFRVEAIFKDSFPHDFLGLNVEANIVIREKNDAMVVPKKLLVGQDTLWIEENGEAVAKKVKTGIANAEMIEIEAGIDTNTVILTPF